MKEKLENLLKEIDEYYYNNNLEDSRRFRYSKLKEFAIEMCKYQLEEVKDFSEHNVIDYINEHNVYGMHSDDVKLINNVANNL